MPDVAEMIAQSYSAEAAKAFRAFEPSDADFVALKQAGQDLQVVFKLIPGACVVMSALLMLRLKTLTKAPAYLVAGSLAVGATRVFGDGDAVDGTKAFGQSNPSWDGHAWVQFGRFIVDTSIFRTAYSSNSPPLLAKHVRATHGEGRGILIGTYEALARDDNLIYEPVCTENQILQY
jgi:hypothetical protein